MNKELKLIKLKESIAANKRLPLEGRLVFGEGSLDARIVFVGEAPGAKEEELGLPFVGRSGKLLEKSLSDIGICRSEVYITNVVKRRPLANRDPSKLELAAYQKYLEQELEIIKPLVVVSLGRFALNYFLPEFRISEVQGEVFKLKDYYLLAVYHPAATFRRKSYLEDFNKSFKTLKGLLRENK